MTSKSITFFTALLLFFLPFHATEAVRNQISQDSLNCLLEIVKGDWYSNTGNKILNIQGGYINGCRVVAGYDWAGSRGNGGAVLRITEKTGLRDIKLRWYVGEGINNFVEIDGSSMLHNTPEVPFFESIDGVHLGMPEEEVQKKWGNPRILTPLAPYTVNGESFRNGWYFPEKGVLLNIHKSEVVAVRLLKESNLQFAHSGLNCRNRPEEFARAYSMRRIPSMPKKRGDGSFDIGAIGHGEAISFGYEMNYVELTLEMY